MDILCTTIDAEKAFDRLERHYLCSVLVRLGLGRDYINMVKMLLANPSVLVMTVGISSPQFSVLNGTHQGCPLSLPLFALSLEPFARKFVDIPW